MFEFTPFSFSPTDMCAVGQYHEDIESRVRQLIADLKQYGLCVPAYMVDDKLKEYNIDYPTLPGYLKDEIDNELEVY